MDRKIHTHGGDIYRHKHTIDFSTNINFRGMPDSVKEAAQKAVEYCVHYPDSTCWKLREAIAMREGISKEHIICGNGAAELIFSLALAMKPKKALLPAPAFYEYEQALLSVDCEIQRYMMKEADGFLPQQDFIDSITSQIDVVFLCNPNNPTGMVLEKGFLEKVVGRCEACDTFLVLDECFNDFLEKSEDYTMKEYIGKSEHIFILRAFTKMYAMAGLRLGYGLCSNKDFMEKMSVVRQPWSVSIPAQMAGAVAAKEVQYALDSTAMIHKERAFMRAELQKKGYFVLDSKANYLFFKGPEDLFERCLQKGFLIRDCSNYEGLSKGWYRVSIKSPQDNRKLLSVL